MNESLTPETDRNLTPTGHIYVSSSSPHVSADFARKLERQRDEARDTLEYIAHAGLSSRHLEDIAREFINEYRPGCTRPMQFHSPACQLSDKCQCDEPEVELSREDIEAERGDRAYQQMKDDEE